MCARVFESNTKTHNTKKASDYVSARRRQPPRAAAPSCRRAASVDLLLGVLGDGLDQALGEQLADGGAREAAVELREISCVCFWLLRFCLLRFEGARGASVGERSGERYSRGGAATQQHASQVGRLTRRRSDRMDVVIILYLGTSAISLS